VSIVGLGATLRHAEKAFDASFQGGLVQQGCEESAYRWSCVDCGDPRGNAGAGDDLAGGVFKKRLNKNMHRSIVLAKSGRHWIFAYLFAKKDRANIDDDELADFRKLAHGLWPHDAHRVKGDAETR